jgi:hypothetical protein
MARAPKRTSTADEIAAMASRGEDVSAHFTREYVAVRPVEQKQEKTRRRVKNLGESSR